MTGFSQKDSPVDDFSLFVTGIASGAACVLGLLWWAAKRWEKR